MQYFYYNLTQLEPFVHFGAADEIQHLPKLFVDI